MPFARCRRAVPAMLLLMLSVPLATRGAPLKVPEGFEVRLVATVPAVLFPCQVATAPDGALFVAEDPMDQVGPYEASDGRILLFREGKEPVVFAEGFRAIFGMAWRDGTLYVSHMPFLSVIRDADGDGKADDREDLFKDLGPTDNRGLNDHIVSGLQFGMDGYLYISVGDKGIPKAIGPDGRTIQLIGGGIVRCRPDGTGIEVVSSGTRNHLEPNLDDRENLFTYDNTDDGLGWWTRVTHHIETGYYGYPYDYHDYTYRMLPQMAEYGGGSPCGALFYKEDVWPEEYRGVGFWAEWGKGKVQAFRFAPEGSTFKVGETFDFAVPDGVNNFRPIDLALSHDGRTLYVADWNMGGWGSKIEKVGRIFAVTYTGGVRARPRGRDSDPIETQIAQLDHPSFNERMRAQAALITRGRAALGAATAALANPRTDPVARRHLVWTVDGIAGGTPEATTPLLAAMESAAADIRAQAARALGERAVPLAEGPLIALVKDPEPTVRLQAIIALGRIKDPKAIPALLPALGEDDAYLAFAARQALRRIDDWKAVAVGLDSEDPKVRAGVLSSLELVYDLDATRVLAGLATDPERRAEERATALTYLAQAHHKALPWDGKWWGTRPYAGRPPAKVLDWEGTPLVLETVREGLENPDAPVRLAAVDAVREIGDREALATLRGRFASEPIPDVRRAAARAFGAMGDRDALPLLIAAVRDPKAPDPVREAALTSVETIGSHVAVRALIDLLEGGQLDVERQPRVIAALGRSKARSAVGPLAARLKDAAPAVRAAAAEALGKIGPLNDVAPTLRAALDDPAPEVRKAAVAALGALNDREAIPALLKAADTDDTRYEATLALAAMPDTLAMQAYLRGLVDKSPDLRKASAAALAKIRDQAVPALERLAQRKELSPTIIPELRRVFTSMQPLMSWQILGPFEIKAPAPIAPRDPIHLEATYAGADDQPVSWKPVQASDEQGEVNLGQIFPDQNGVAAYGYVEVQSPVARDAPMAVGSDDTLTVWVNGKQVYNFQDNRGLAAEAARFDVTLDKGTNRILVKCGNHGGPWGFIIALTVPGEYAFLKAPAQGGFDPEAFRALRRGPPATRSTAAPCSTTSGDSPASSATPSARRGAPSGPSSRPSGPNTPATS